MNQLLPTALDICGSEYPINSDYRVMLNIFDALNDPELNEREKCFILLNNLFCDAKNIPKNHLQDALEAAVIFADGGTEQRSTGAKILDWQQDSHILFPAINKAAGCEIRAIPYLHWWSFLGLFGEVGEGLFSQVLHIRKKRSKGKKLEKWEQEFYREHKSLIEIKRRYTQEEQAEIDRLNSLLD